MHQIPVSDCHKLFFIIFMYLLIIWLLKNFLYCNSWLECNQPTLIRFNILKKSCIANRSWELRLNHILPCFFYAYMICSVMLKVRQKLSTKIVLAFYWKHQNHLLRSQILLSSLFLTIVVPFSFIFKNM